MRHFGVNSSANLELEQTQTASGFSKSKEASSTKTKGGFMAIVIEKVPLPIPRISHQKAFEAFESMDSGDSFVLPIPLGENYADFRNRMYSAFHNHFKGQSLIRKDPNGLRVFKK